MNLKVHDVAPDFALFDSQHRLVQLRDFRGKHVVLYFYPKDDTPGCTTEACAFRDYASEFSGLNTVIVGVSKDTEASHVRFINKYGLPFTLLADPEAAILRKYGVWREQNLMGRLGMGTARTTFVIDPEGQIARIYEDVKVSGHVEEVLRDLKASQAQTLHQ